MCHVMVASSASGRSHKTFWAGPHFLRVLSTDFSQRRPVPSPKKLPALEVQGKNGDVEALGNFSLPNFLFRALAHLS
jgi:hypothetical protein